jgi:hypothetical protein
MEKDRSFMNRFLDRNYIGLIFLITIIKTGLSPIGPEFVGWLREAARAMPREINYLHAAPLPLVLMKFLNYPSDFVWWSISFIFFGFWISISLLCISKRFPKDFKLYAVFFLTSPAVALSGTMIGHIDIFTLIGATLAIFSNYRIFIVAGALIAAGGNVDQSIVTSLSLILLILGGSKRARKIASLWVPISLIAYLLIKLVFKVQPTSNIKDLLFVNLKNISMNSFGMWHLELFSVLSLSWIFVTFFIWPNLRTLKTKFFVMSAIFILPFTLTFFVLDGTRVGVVVGFMSLWLAFIEFGKTPRFIQDNLNEFYLLILFAAFFIPAIIVGNGNVLRLPYLKFISFFY